MPVDVVAGDGLPQTRAERKTKGFSRIASIAIVSSRHCETIEAPKRGKEKQDLLPLLHERREENDFISAILPGSTVPASMEIGPYCRLNPGR